MDISLNSGWQQVWSNRSVPSAEEALLKALINTCFMPAPEWGAWLVHHTRNGQGVALIVGPLRPQRKKLKRLYPLVRVASVPERFQELLLVEGPAALMWNGKEVIARGH